MKTLLGIDLGTSSLKAMLLDTDSGESVSAMQEYEVEIPQTGWAEQHPDVWWNATLSVLSELKASYPAQFKAISGIGLSGQMHGLVCLDNTGTPVCPAILWLDQRSAPQLARLTPQQHASIAAHTQNSIFAGSAFASLLWMQEERPDLLARTHTILLPKDYIRFRLTGTLASDYSDACGTAVFSPHKHDWAWELIDRFSLSRSIFPPCFSSSELAGPVLPRVASTLGFSQPPLVVYGAGDQPCQSIGNGAIRENTLICNIGSGGQIAAFLQDFRYDKALRTQTYCHAVTSAYTILGATLNAGMSLNWFANKVLQDSDYAALSDAATAIPAGSEGLIFLPYLTGERTPHMDPHAKGMFFGLDLGHDRRHFTRAIMEGVVFSLKDSLQIFQEQGIDGDTIIASGGGASSPAWLQIQADILEKEVRVCAVKEQACLGACLLAGVGIGVFPSLEEACQAHVSFQETRYTPNPLHFQAYRARFAQYQALYQRNQALMRSNAAPSLAET